MEVPRPDNLLAGNTIPTQLTVVAESKPDGAGLVLSYEQRSTVHKVPDRARESDPIPSLHFKYLTRAGVAHDYSHVPDAAIYGNGHAIDGNGQMMMVEKDAFVMVEPLDRRLMCTEFGRARLRRHRADKAVEVEFSTAGVFELAYGANPVTLVAALD